MMLPKNGFLGVKFGLAASFFMMFVIDCVEETYLPKILVIRGFSSADIGELRALGYGMVIVAPFLYALIAQFMNNRRLAIQVGSWLSGIAIISLFGKWGFLGFGVLMMCQSFFQQGTASQLDALAMNTLDDTSSYGPLRLGGSLGYIVSVITGGFVADHFGFLNIIWYMILVQFLMLATICFLPSDRLTQQEIDIEKEKQSNGSAEEKKSSKFPIRIDFVLVILFVFFQFMSQGVYRNFMMIYMTTKLGISNGMGGAIMSMALGVEMIGLVFSMFILKHFKIRTLLCAAGMVGALRWFMQGFGAQYMVILLSSQILHVFTFAIMHLAVLKFINQNFDYKKHVAIAIGIYGSAGLGLGRCLGSLSAGFTWDLGVHTAFGVAVILSFISGVIGFFVKSRCDSRFDKSKDEDSDTPETVAS